MKQKKNNIKKSIEVEKNNQTVKSDKDQTKTIVTAETTETMKLQDPTMEFQLMPISKSVTRWQPM